MSVRGVGIRLEGPMQSWGGPTAGDDRPTLDVPTKSGVLGLVGAALGLDRADAQALSDLHASFALGVRVDTAGVLGVDFHTAMEVPTAEGRVRPFPVLSRRTYLYDASFAAILVERPGATTSAEEVIAALASPRWPLFLGRRGCPPSAPVLAHRSVLEGSDALALFLAIAPGALAEGPSGSSPPADLYLERSLVGEADASRLTRVRDRLTGRVARIFAERVVVRMTASHPTSASATRANTVDGWFS